MLKEKLSYGILEADEDIKNKGVGKKREWGESKEITSAPKFEEAIELLKEMWINVKGKIIIWYFGGRRRHKK